MKIENRSQRASLLEGATDGKYRKRRPDTELNPMNGRGDQVTEANRDGLNPFENYGYITSEATRKVNPGR